MTDEQPRKGLDTRTYLMRVHGLAGTDADAMIDRISREAVEEYFTGRNEQDVQPAEPLRTMTTTEGVGDAMVVRTWVNVESLTETLVDQVTTMVADQLIRTLATANKEMGHAGST
jgi:hypothetical protein